MAVAIASASIAVGVLVVGKAPYDNSELVEFFGTAGVWSAADSDDLTQMAGQALTPGRARRSLLWRSAVEVAADVASLAVASVPAAGVKTSGTGERRFA